MRARMVRMNQAFEFHFQVSPSTLRPVSVESWKAKSRLSSVLGPSRASMSVVGVHGKLETGRP